MVSVKRAERRTAPRDKVSSVRIVPTRDSTSFVQVQPVAYFGSLDQYNARKAFSADSSLGDYCQQVNTTGILIRVVLENIPAFVREFRRRPFYQYQIIRHIFVLAIKVEHSHLLVQHQAHQP